MQTLEILEEIGFTKGGMGHVWDFGNGTVTAVEAFGFRSGQAIYLAGFIAMGQRCHSR